MIAFSVNENTITLVLGGSSYSVSRGTPRAAAVLRALRSAKPPTDEEIRRLVRPTTAALNQLHGAIKRDKETGQLVYQNLELGAPILKKIQIFGELGLQPAPILRFLRRLAANPSQRVVSELWAFLEHGNMPVTDQGFFLAYKGIQQNWLDKYSGKFLNKPGTTLSMPRNKVCDDPDQGCSKGFHAGSLDYARGYACSDGRIVIVRIDPADVVSVPKDCSFQKLRTCRYKVLQEYREPLAEAYAGRKAEAKTQRQEEQKRQRGEMAAALAKVAAGRKLVIKTTKSGALLATIR
jgi:hypothetical protein